MLPSISHKAFPKRPLEAEGNFRSQIWHFKQSSRDNCDYVEGIRSSQPSLFWDSSAFAFESSQYFESDAGWERCKSWGKLLQMHPLCLKWRVARAEASQMPLGCRARPFIADWPVYGQDCLPSACSRQIRWSSQEERYARSQACEKSSGVCQDTFNVRKACLPTQTLCWSAAESCNLNEQ